MKLPNVTIVDEACLGEDYLMRPYLGRVLTLQWEHLNKRISTARKYIECECCAVFVKWLILFKYTETCTGNTCTNCFIYAQVDTNRSSRQYV